MPRWDENGNLIQESPQRWDEHGNAITGTQKRYIPTSEELGTPMTGVPIGPGALIPMAAGYGWAKAAEMAGLPPWFVDAGGLVVAAATGLASAHPTVKAAVRNVKSSVGEYFPNGPMGGFKPKARPTTPPPSDFVSPYDSPQQVWREPPVQYPASRNYDPNLGFTPPPVAPALKDIYATPEYTSTPIDPEWKPSAVKRESPTRPPTPVDPNVGQKPGAAPKAKKPAKPGPTPPAQSEWRPSQVRREPPTKSPTPYDPNAGMVDPNIIQPPPFAPAQETTVIAKEATVGNQGSGPGTGTPGKFEATLKGHQSAKAQKIQNIHDYLTTAKHDYTPEKLIKMDADSPGKLSPAKKQFLADAHAWASEQGRPVPKNGYTSLNLQETRPGYEGQGSLQDVLDLMQGKEINPMHMPLKDPFGWGK